MTVTTVAPTVAPERVTPLRPSEALRLGRVLMPGYACGRLLDTEPDGTMRGCAEGAMAVGFGRWNQAGGGFWWPEEWPERHVQPPCGCGRNPEWVGKAVAHLSDFHHPQSPEGWLLLPAERDRSWSDSRIADWLESVGY